ncbi:MAG: YggT family protein [Candidatus Limnocylindrales bacterium]
MTYRTEVEVTDPGETVVRDRLVERQVVTSPDPLGVVRRLIVFIFGLIQLLIGLRILLLLFAARGSNDIVAGIYNISDIFVAPFRGILRIEEVQSGATALDVGAIVALIGWTVIELVVLALVRVFRPSATA